jgi:ketosteroid isomerase-like protein
VPGVLSKATPRTPVQDERRNTEVMLEENIAVVRRGYDHYNRTGEPDYSLLDPDVVYDVSRRVFDPGVYRGHEGVREFARLIREQWETMRIEPQDFIVAGDDVVVVPVRLVGALRPGHGLGSEHPVWSGHWHLPRSRGRAASLAGMAGCIRDPPRLG